MEFPEFAHPHGLEAKIPRTLIFHGSKFLEGKLAQ